MGRLEEYYMYYDGPLDNIKGLKDIASSHEKKGGTPISNKCNKFKEKIDQWGLLDLSEIDSRFTWRGPICNGGQRIWKILNWALCNDSWRINFQDGYVKVLTWMDF